MLIDASQFISQSLAPAFVLSGVGLLTVGLHNRLLVIAGRIRDLNREIRNSETPLKRQANARLQVKLLIRRVHLVRNALFLLYGAMGLMVLTALFIAFHELFGTFPKANMPIWAFLSGLFFILAAVVLEAFGIVINLTTIELDTQNSEAVQEDNQKA